MNDFDHRSRLLGVTACLLTALLSFSTWPAEPRGAAGNAPTAALPDVADSAWARLDPAKLKLRSEAVLVVDEDGNPVYSKASNRRMAIASITKLMTAVVVLDSGVSLDQRVTITKADRDLNRLTGSRLDYGDATLSRRELLTVALMSSENRAAAALGRTTLPGGTPAFVRAMNRKAKALGMTQSRFVDTTGLDAGNISTPRDLVRLLKAARGYETIQRATTRLSMDVRPYRKHGPLHYVNTNRLMRNPDWDIGLSKTGYITESGRCLVMEASVFGRTLYIVLLNSFGKLTPFGDSNRLRKWIARSVEEETG